MLAPPVVSTMDDSQVTSDVLTPRPKHTNEPVSTFPETVPAIEDLNQGEKRATRPISDEKVSPEKKIPKKTPTDVQPPHPVGETGSTDAAGSDARLEEAMGKINLLESRLFQVLGELEKEKSKPGPSQCNKEGESPAPVTPASKSKAIPSPAAAATQDHASLTEEEEEGESQTKDDMVRFPSGLAS